jgi:recombinational DNA repair protein RecT
MDANTILQIKAASKAANGPWKQWFTQMARKAVIKRAANYWGIDNNLAATIELMNDLDGNAEPFEKEVGPVTNSQTLNNLLSPAATPMHLEKPLDEWIAEAKTGDDLRALRDVIRDVEDDHNRNNLQKLWMGRRNELKEEMKNG